MKLNMESPQSPWMSTNKMSQGRKHFTLTTLHNKVYALGGIYGEGIETSSLNYFERYRQVWDKWDYQASYPFPIYRHCAAADEETGRIWVTGGTWYGNGERTDVRYYEKSTNSWHHPKNLIWHRYEHACGILKIASTNQKRLYVVGGYHYGWRDYVEYLDLDTMSGFHHVASAPTWTARMRFVNTDPYHALLVGGYTGWVGASNR